MLKNTHASKMQDAKHILFSHYNCILKKKGNTIMYISIQLDVTELLSKI